MVLSYKGSKKEKQKLILKSIKGQCQTTLKDPSTRVLPGVLSVIPKPGEHRTKFEGWMEKKNH